MRIAYCTNVRLPNERAHGHQVARVCDALSKLGYEVSIFAPYRRENPVQVGFHEFHTVDPRVKITHLPSFDGIACRATPGVLGLWVTTWSYCRKLRPHLIRENFDLLYTRTPEILLTLLPTGIPVVLELHKLPRRGRRRFIKQCKKCAVVSCLTSPMRDELVACGVPKEKTIVEGDAVDLVWFDKRASSTSEVFSSREPRRRHIIGYAGSFRSMGLEKGIRELIDAIVVLKRQGVELEARLVGSFTGTKEYYQQVLDKGLKSPDIQIHNYIAHSMVPKFLRECSVLVYPAPKISHPFFTRDTSPLKIFEYMAAERPIVAADLPPIRDILDESTAEFFRPGDSEDLACAIQSVLSDPDRAQSKAAKARQRVEEHTWEKRMGRIMRAATMKIVSIVSARPNFVKLAAILHALKEGWPEAEHIIVHTGQHYDLLLSTVFFQQLGIPEPDKNLGMKGGETNEDTVNRTRDACIPVLQNIQPKMVIVYGDVAGALGGAQAAHELGIPVAHVESGLRSFDASMPEEGNRIAIDRVASFLFVTEQSGIDHLKKEGITKGVHFVGNTMIDTLKRMEPTLEKEPRSPYKLPKRYGIVTLHRPSNVDRVEDLSKVISFLAEVAEVVPLVLPVHPRLRHALDEAKFSPSLFENIQREDPYGYVQFLRRVREAKFILTDSGGVQEEATYLKKKCFTLRKNTERPSTIESGSNELIDLDKEEDRKRVLEFAAHPVPPEVKIPEKWDGKAGERIVQILKTEAA